MVQTTFVFSTTFKKRLTTQSPSPFFLRPQPFRPQVMDEVLLEKVGVGGRHEDGEGAYLNDADVQFVKESPLVNCRRINWVLHDEAHHLHPPRFLLPVVLGTSNVHLEVPSVFFSMGDARRRHGGGSLNSVCKRHVGMKHLHGDQIVSIFPPS